MHPILACKNVNVLRNEVRALVDVSFELLPGEIVGIHGPNGAGKSTLLDVFSLCVCPRSGSVLFNGMPLKGQDYAAAAAAGIVRLFQSSELAWRWSVARNVAMVIECRPNARDVGGRGDSRWLARNRAAINAEAMGLLDLIGMQTHAQLRAAALSHGQSRRVALACCLAQNPRVLLLDEPFAAIDSGGTAYVQHLCRAIARRGTSVLLCDHNLDLIRKTCGRLFSMSDGVIKRMDG